MKKKFLIFSIIFPSILFNAFSQKNVVKWQNAPIVIDGNPLDWGTKLRFFHSDSKIQYDIRNDQTNLYLILLTSDNSMMQQLMQAGCKLTLKVKTNPSVNTSFVIKESKQPEKMPEIIDKSYDPTKTKRPDIYKQNTGQYMDKKPEFGSKFQKSDTANVKGFRFTDKTVISGTENNNRINFVRNFSIENKAVIEIIFPFRELFGDDYSFESITNYIYKLQVNINAISGNNDSGEMRGGQRGGPGGMGGGPNEMGGGPDGVSGGEMGDRPPMMGDVKMDNSTSMTRKSFKTEFSISNEKM